jgi:hypothetical protein
VKGSSALSNGEIRQIGQNPCGVPPEAFVFLPEGLLSRNALRLLLLGQENKGFGRHAAGVLPNLTDLAV